MNADEFVAKILENCPPFPTEVQAKVLLDGELYDVNYVEFESNSDGDQIVIVVQ